MYYVKYIQHNTFKKINQTLSQLILLLFNIKFKQYQYKETDNKAITVFQLFNF